MKIHLAMLISDWLIFGLTFTAILCLAWLSRRQQFREKWRRVFQTRLAMMATLVLLVYIVIGLTDSIHVKISQPDSVSHQVSLLDILLTPLIQHQEQSYSAPFALYALNRVMVIGPNGKPVMQYPRLQHAANDLQSSDLRLADISERVLWGFSLGCISFLLFFLLFSGLVMLVVAKGRWQGIKRCWHWWFEHDSDIPWRTGIITLAVLWVLIMILLQLIFTYHVLGTDKVGTDVFYLTIKSIRTGILIGTLTTLFMLPLALLLGMAAGYFRGWIDDIIQYSYTTLSSIPGVLLISAMVLVLDVYMSRHAYLFPSLEQRADARLLILCLILGITSWSTLCRFLRGETLKLRRAEFVEVARTFGVSHIRIILRHIMPNVMHIVIITLVLDFSSLVLMEAVLSYIGVGVDPSMISWGNMINSSRLEMAREPLVWWPLFAALIFMFTLVLVANLFADAVRDAFDPRLHQQN